jgi:hypothetical protein
MHEPQPSALPAAAMAAVLVSVAPDALEARLVPPAAGRVPVRLAVASAYTPSVGDRVLVLSDGRDAYVVGVLHAGESRGLSAGGVHARAADGALEVCDGGGRVIARFRDGAAEISAPEGDLELTAPRGQVRLRSALDVTVEAGRAVAVKAAGRVALGVEGGPEVTLTAERATVASEHLSLQTRHAEVAAGRVDAVVGYLATTARRIAYNTERFELTAERVVERAHSALHEVNDLLEVHLGRARTIVARAWSLKSGRTVMRSERDTAIDGKKILLG